MTERPPPYQHLVEGEYDWNSSESPPQPHRVHPPQQSAQHSAPSANVRLILQLLVCFSNVCVNVLCQLFLRRNRRLYVGIAFDDSHACLSLPAIVYVVCMLYMYVYECMSICQYVNMSICLCLCMQDTVMSQSLHWTSSTANFGADPLSNFECPRCQIVVTTRTRQVVVWNSYLCLILGLIFCGVLALPLLCILNYYDVEHYCPACGESVGTYVHE